MRFRLRRQYDGSWIVNVSKSVFPVCVGTYALCRTYLWFSLKKG